MILSLLLESDDSEKFSRCDYQVVRLTDWPLILLNNYNSWKLISKQVCQSVVLTISAFSKYLSLGQLQQLFIEAGTLFNLLLYQAGSRVSVIVN